MIRTLCLSLTATLALTASANAQTAIPPYPSAVKANLSAAPLNLRPAGPIELRYAQAPTPLPRGVARTAVERRSGSMSSGVGVLCGIQPSADSSGIGTSRGYDNEGRFVGAKLGFSF